MAVAEPLKIRARTKIVATVGPSCQDAAILEELIAAGVDLFRINMAHGDRAQHDALVEAVRAAAASKGWPIATLVDLAGPKIRLGRLLEDLTLCPLGAEFQLTRGQRATRPDQLVCSYERLIDELSVGDPIMLADGTVGMEVVAKDADSASCRVVAPGTIRPGQGINVPGAALSLPALTEADLDNALWAAQREIDFVGLSFVRSADEVRQLQEWLQSHGSSAAVVAKIERREALAQLEPIVQAADAVMVARGDLGVEIDVAETPVAQKRIVETCRRLQKPVIVATQMLDSMQHARRPTRAEASDVANAVFEGADACMLSAETAIGEHPSLAVETMNRIIRVSEKMLGERSARDAPSVPAGDVHQITSAVVYGAARIAERVDATMVVIASRSGATARVKAKQHDFIPTVGVSDDPGTLRRMCLYWGITPLSGAPIDDGPELRRFIDQWGRAEGGLAAGDRVVFVAGRGVVQRAHNQVVVHVVQ